MHFQTKSLSFLVKTLNKKVKVKSEERLKMGNTEEGPIEGFQEEGWAV